MRNTYTYSLLKSTWMNIVNREELLSMLSTRDLTSAVKTIVNKPVGSVLYDTVSKNIYSFNELDNRLVCFNNERILSIYRKLDYNEKQLINNLNTLFDITNLYFTIVLINSSRKASLIYPAGLLSTIDLSSIDSISSLKNNLPSYLSEIVDILLSSNISDLSNLVTIYTRYRIFNRDHLINKVIGFLHDSLLIKTCLFTKQTPTTGVSLSTMYISDFENICSIREIKTLPQILHGINPIYSGFSELLSELFSIKDSYELIDLAIVLYSTNLSSDLIYTIEHVVIRTYLLFLAEAMVIRIILQLIESKLYIDKFRDIVSKWWNI